MGRQSQRRKVHRRSPRPRFAPWTSWHVAGGSWFAWPSCLHCARTSSAEEESGDELVQLVVNLLSDKDKDVRALGLEQVRTEAKGAAATQQFAAQLPKLPAEAQVGLLSALADRGDPAARPAVLDLLAASHDEPVRLAAIGALGFLGEPADARLLLRLLRRVSPAEQAAARTSLVRLPGESVGR